MDRNFILAIALAMLIFFGYDALFVAPKRAAWEEQQAAAQVAAEAQAAEQAETQNTDGSGAEESGLPPLDPNMILTLDEALTRTSDRLPVETPQFKGSINLRGLTFDDLVLTQFHETVDDSSPLVRVLSPQNTGEAQFIRTGLELNGRPDNTVQWTAPEGAVLSPGNDVTLTPARVREGFNYSVTLSVDEKFMFTVTHTVGNATGSDIAITPYGETMQKGIPSDLRNMMILFEGPLGVAGEKPFQRKYKDILKKGGVEERGTGGWVGLTDKFWLSAAIPAQDQAIKASVSATGGAVPMFKARYERDRILLADGQTTSITSHVYTGAKLVEVLRSYEAPVSEGGLGVSRFDMAVDWGNFYFLTRPIFNALHFFNGIVGNYGIAILLLTLVIKAILFPLANMSYKSMAGLRKVQPEMQRLRERYKDDQVKQQQEMMALYKKHKINPAAGCLPILAQMPIFFALYKTLFTTIEMRHEPFLYIPDLSERDPTTIFNLFGLLPFDPTTIPVIGGFLGIGVLPLIMGAGMWVQMKLNPPPTDPMQARIFGLMPLFFLFIFAPFAAGLVLYWAWNTLLSVIQQYVIMKRQGAEVDLIGNIKQSLGIKQVTANDNKSGS